MKFEYMFFEGRFAPMVPLRLQGKKEWIEVHAFVDTGASYCLFPADTAEALGLIMEKGELSEMTVGDGNVLKVYLHQTTVSMAGKEFMATIGFSKGLGVGFYIIGTRDIFDNVKNGLADRWSETSGMLASLAASPFLSTQEFHLSIGGSRSEPPFKEWWNSSCFNVCFNQKEKYVEFIPV